MYVYLCSIFLYLNRDIYL